MSIRPAATLASIALAFAVLAAPNSRARTPPGYPSNYAETIAAAGKEGKLVIYSTTDTKAAEPLVKDFQALYPAVKVEYNDMNSTEVYNRFISEVAAGGATADVLWSSAMDLQIKLASDGYAQQYKSPEIPNLPDWAVWNNVAFGTTYEPAVFVYNKRLVPEGEVPKTHAEFAKLLLAKTDKYRNKVTTYDIEKSGVGFMFITQDSRENPQFRDLVKAFGATTLRVQSSTGTMMERISSGENLIGYNILGSYALVRAQTDKGIGVVIPKDYALVLSRVLFISKTAKNVNAAKLWTDYTLSKRGQTVIANQAQLFSIRKDVTGETTAANLTKQFGASLKPLPVNPMLLLYLEQNKRLAFIKDWKEALAKK
jgi:iron(III) transport system substrate-binding protein